MKTIIEINSTNYASTGNITLNIAKIARESGYQVFTFAKASKESYKHNYDNQFFFGNRYERILSDELAYLTGFREHFNFFGTKALVKKLKELKPDLIHLHVLHDNILNYKILFDYLKTINIPIVWTFHDVSALTGQCPAFEMIGCDKWQTCCDHCPQIHTIPDSKFFDTTKKIFNYKKECYAGLKNLTIVTPSSWLKGVVGKSILKDYPIRLINNGIDLSIFHPTDNKFKKEHNLQDKYIILGVANAWLPRKGLDVFIELSKMLPNNYQIVLVGTNDEVDKSLPSNIISIHRTYNQGELVDIYSSSDIFVNPTREDNFPTVNIEALACGTPVITFNTGGSSEIIDKTCGSVIEKNDINGLYKEIIRVVEEKPYTKKACLQRASQFDMNKKLKEYIDLYHQLLNDGV